MSAWFKGAVGLVLGIAQIIAIVFWLSHPRVSEMYQQFFVSNIRDCWLPDEQAAQSRDGLAGLISYSPSSLSKDEACYLLMKGWDGYDSSTALSVNATSWLDLPVPPGSHKVVLTFTAMIPSGVLKLRVRVNGRFAGELKTPKAPAQASIVLDVPENNPTEMIVELRPHFLEAVHGIGFSQIAWSR